MVYSNIGLINFMKEKMHTYFQVIVLINCKRCGEKSMALDVHSDCLRKYFLYLFILEIHL